MTVLEIVVALFAFPVLLATGYLFALTLSSGRRTPPACSAEGIRFDAVVPAHDEEEGIGRTVQSLLALAWPRDRFRVVVVADNCSDATAAEAARHGATVLVRQDPSLRGKGYALEFAFARILQEGRTDAVVVIDADTVASPDLLTALAARLQGGAHAIQASYGVLNPEASWRTRLMTLAFALVNDLRSLGRERLGLSCGLKGNGMCFSTEGLRRVPHQAYSIVEDLEYGILLAEAGLRVHFVWETGVRGVMVSGAAASRTQRQRWEGGRRAFVRSRALPLLWRGLARRDPVLLDLAAELLVPPLTSLVLFLALGSATAVGLWAAGGGVVPLALWAAAWPMLLAYLLRGLQISGLGLAGLTALCWAPVYGVWKLTTAATGRRRPTEWVRTERERPSPPPPGKGP